MKKPITKAQAQDFKKRWGAVNLFQRKELQGTTINQKLQKLAVLMASGKALKWTEALSAEEEKVRELWKQLKRKCDENA